MATFTSTIDALNTLCTSIPEWNTRLEELNGQIAQRQIELAQLTEDRPPTARSVRNKGSTESLRPRDGDENPFGHAEDIPMNPFESPRSMDNSFPAGPRPSSVAARAAAAASPSPPQSIPKSIPNPKASPSALNRQSSHPTHPTKPRVAAAVLRKRKTDSLASEESIAPKYRTRSMIIVYYDSAVQTAFEELVKFVSVSRSAMRKGKMAAKMSEMRRAAELEVEGEDEDTGGDTRPHDVGSGLSSIEPRVPVPQANNSTLEPDDEKIPKLRYVSTRQMGPPRDYSKPMDNMSSGLGLGMGLGMMKGYRRSGGGTADIFDVIDKGLEWCQSQCEHAAHQFLRDGECTTEISNIKKKLGEIKDVAEKDIERMKREEAIAPKRAPARVMSSEPKGRGLRDVQMRRDTAASQKDYLEADDSAQMEVDDDEGVDDMEPPNLFFKRSRDVSR